MNFDGNFKRLNVDTIVCQGGFRRCIRRKVRSYEAEKYEYRDTLSGINRLSVVLLPSSPQKRSFVLRLDRVLRTRVKCSIMSSRIHSAVDRACVFRWFGCRDRFHQPHLPMRPLEAGRDAGSWWGPRYVWQLWFW